ncbi:MAG: hypothetical protein U1E73_00610 [Planctomycetota bacterium]
MPIALAAVLCLQAWLVGYWIVDDAGITFAYARNAAAGHGWVACAGDAPLEGFSNLLWALLLVPFLWLGAFDPVVTPKVLGLVAAFATLLLVGRAIGTSRGETRPWADFGLLLLAVHPTFVVWSLSGLENGLYALCIATLLLASERAAHGSTSRRRAIGAGLIAGMAAATRPDGLVFAAWWPLTVLLAAPGALRERCERAALAAAVTAACIVGMTIWRWETFGDVVPNTFHAKVGSSAPPRKAERCDLPTGVVLLDRMRAHRHLAAPRFAVLPAGSPSWSTTRHSSTTAGSATVISWAAAENATSAAANATAIRRSATDRV